MNDLGVFINDSWNLSTYQKVNSTFSSVIEENGEFAWTKVLIISIKAIFMCSIIIISVLGNSLVIASIFLHRKLQALTNYFLLSLAVADMLVALCAMTFNASVELSGRWLFGSIMCDLWNSSDVYFSTVSILHLCCISVDRYYAILMPLEYPIYVTKLKVYIMLLNIWSIPTLISFLPILKGWYTTDEHLKEKLLHPDVCSFEVNKVYAILSSAISFWIPCSVMVVLYYKIFQEARKQESAIISRTNSTCTINNIHRERAMSSITVHNVVSNLKQLKLSKPMQTISKPENQPIPLRSFSYTLNDSYPPNAESQISVVDKINTESELSSKHDVTETAISCRLLHPPSHQEADSEMTTPGTPEIVATEDTVSRTEFYPSFLKLDEPSSPVLRNGSFASVSSYRRSSSIASKSMGRQSLVHTPLMYPQGGMIRREHKAAKTLGLIMGAFVLCWLPFFTWYVTITICGDNCPCPQVIVSILFWVGYLNSTLNPFIYAYFRTDFREAFKKTLQQLNICSKIKSRRAKGDFV